ncbi:MAG: 5-formyltetrahydrofolate cyclo-ligase [Clostridiales bacterium]|nr:5-formyltetrahydrofolate cyclo-ligase [Clostridiales bacterium]
MDKQTLRKTLIEQRDRIPVAEAEAAAAAAAEELFRAFFYRKARSIFVFVSVGNEPGTSPIIMRALADGKKVCVPRTSAGRRMEAVPVENEAAFEKAYTDWPRSYGIPEPPAHIPAADPETLDLVIVPSLAVDRQGYRIGYGGGYYDTFIAKFADFGIREKESTDPKNRPVFAALQYDAFLLDDPLPREPHDMQVNVIVTEKGILALN